MNFGNGYRLKKNNLNRLRPFIIRVNTANSGISNSDQFQFTGAEGDYSVVAKQGGLIVSIFPNLSGEQTITLPSPGIYDLEIKPKLSNGFNRIKFREDLNPVKVNDIKQWGNTVWSSIENLFLSNNQVIITATDAPNLTLVTNMQSSMRGNSLNPDVSNWDVSNVTNMNFMFLRATSANPDVSNWDVSNVTTMILMFFGSNLSTQNLTLIYENWSQLTLQQNVVFDVGDKKYNTSGQAGRDILVNTYNWTVIDGGQI